MNPTEREILNKAGWLEFQGAKTNEELISLAKVIGQIQKHPNGSEIFTLTPKNGVKSTKGTFSSKYGYGKFPLHTDTAFYTQPIRYMILSMNKSSDTFTTLLTMERLFDGLNPEEEYIASRAIYKVKTSESSFYSSLIFKNNGAKSIRYDPTCMFPANNHAKEFDAKLQEMFAQLEPEIITWNEPKTLVIDNWKVLHGRSSTKENEQREMKRIYIS